MSLEDSILTLTKSIDALNARLSDSKTPLVSRGTTKPPVKPTPPPKYDDVREAILSLSERVNMPAAVEVLSRFGVTHAKELKPDQYADVLAACRDVSSSD